MAYALPSFPSTKETTNYARLCRLLVDVGSQALRETFDSIHPPAGLHHVLGRHPEHATLQSLHTGRRRVINPTQWGKLYPTIPSSVSSVSFDITLLMILLRNICGLHPPATGWDSLPLPADTSKEANIARVKYYRNTVYGHASQASIDDATFNTYWQDISNTLVALGGASYGAAINKLKNECMDPDTEEHYRELLKQWKKDEDSIKDKLVEIEGNISDKLGEEADNIRCHFEKLMENFTTQLERSILKDKDNIGSHIEKMMDDLMAQLERAILKDKDDIRSHIEKMMENFMTQLKKSSSKDKDCLHSTCLWPYQNSSGRVPDNTRSHIEKMMDNFMGKLKRSILGDKVSCFVVLIPLCEHRGRGDHKRSLKQQAWNRPRKKHFKKMAKKDKRRPGGVVGLRELTDDEKQQQMTHKDDRQPCENNRLSELTEIEKQQAEKCLEEMTKKDEKQPGGNYVFSDRNEAETRQEEKDLKQGKTEKLISIGQDTSSSLKMTHEDERQPGRNDRLFKLTDAEKKQAEGIIYNDERQPSRNDDSSDLTEAEEKQADKDFKELKDKTRKMIRKAKDTVWSLREAADKLDEVRRGWKVDQASAELVGGVLTAAGGIMTVFTPRAGTPLLIAGIAFGVASAGIKGDVISRRVTETCINSTEMKKALKDVEETSDCVNDVRGTVQLWLDRKEKNMSYLQFLAERTLDSNNPVEKILHSFIILALHEDAKRKVIFPARLKLKYSQTNVHAATDMYVDGVGFMGITIRYLVENKRLKQAAKFLREEADRLEAI